MLIIRLMKVRGILWRKLRNYLGRLRCLKESGVFLWDCDATKKVWFRIIPSNKLTGFFSEEVVKGSYSWVQQYSSTHKEGRSGSHASREDFVGTDKWIHIRTDEAVKINTDSASTNGLLRDQNGDWVFGFNRRI
ncbi:hypothetical protein J1N35_040700 [Gossypium stocksii]|uniref:Uncharacterized protein n=1 Tax=Gossypium stocksii TaxID=47602 RepID=A0A9D3UE31_9ROSI|nr:hypothetical protein J1N35_040700 [Gossypium stocksii]